MFSRLWARFESREINRLVMTSLAILFTATLFALVQPSREQPDGRLGEEPPGQGCCPHHGPPPPPPPGVPPTVLFLTGGALGYLIGTRRPPCGPPHHHKPRPSDRTES